MTFRSPKKFRNASSAWEVGLVVCLAAVLVFLVFEWGHTKRHGGKARPKLGSDVYQMQMALPRFAKYYYPSFATMPTNVLLTTSRVFFDAWPKLGALIVTGEERPRATTNTGLVDCFGNNYNLIMNQLSALGATTVTYQVMMWSNGPNGTNEYGKGDDWPRTFTFTVDPTLPPLE